LSRQDILYFLISFVSRLRVPIKLLYSSHDKMITLTRMKVIVILKLVSYMNMFVNVRNTTLRN